VTTIVVSGLIVLVAVLFTLLLRQTRRAMGPITGTTWLTAFGVVITLAGVVDLIWTQIDVRDAELFGGASYRWNIAGSAIIVIALGLLVCVGAQILRAVQDHSAREVGERSRGTG
jgi:hypothetical protein